MKINDIENFQEIVWFGSAAPSDWDVTRLRFLIGNNTEQVPGKFAGDFYLELEDIESKTGRLLDSERDKSPESSVKKFQKGDVLFGRLRPYLAKGWVCNRSGTCVGEILVFRPNKKSDKKFLGYRILADDFIRYVNSAAYGAKMPRIGWPFLADVRVPWPSKHIQQTIARFLDHKTILIDQYIANKKKQIELLEKLRTSIISEAVTKGLNPDVEMKDSGVEWLGKIPRHWELWKLKFVVSFVTSGSRGWAQYYSDEGALFVRITNLQRNSIDLNFSKPQLVQPPSGSEGERTGLEEGDVLVSITADIGSIGVVPVCLGESYVNQHTALTRPRKKLVDSRWLAYCLFSDAGKAQFAMLLQGGTKDGLELGDVKNLAIPKPPLVEQSKLARYLDEKIRSIDHSISQLNIQIEKIQTYRTSLISEAVTGKIDVRSFTPEPMVT
jgi:type I restriction enzyme, S subunit